MNDLNNINNAIASLNSKDLLSVIPCGDKCFAKKTNCKKLTATIKYIKDAQSFEKCLLIYTNHP